MDRIKQEIELHEKKLTEFIYHKITVCIQDFCRWKLHAELKKEMAMKEDALIREKAFPKFLEEVKKIAPLHYSEFNMDSFCDPIHVMFNGMYCRMDHRDFYEWNKEYQRGAWYWCLITYNDCMEAGYDKNFVKRIIEKLIQQKILRQKRGVGGYLYTLNDLQKVKEKITFTSVGLAMKQDRYEYLTNETWIYDRFKEDYLKEKFNKIVLEVFKTIKEE